MQNLFELLSRSVKLYGDKVFCSIREGRNWRRLSFRQLHDSALALARGLKAYGIRPGDNIGILSENRPEWDIAFFGIIRAGAAVVPIDKLLKKEDRSNILARAKPKLIFVSKNYLTAVAESGFTTPVVCFDSNDMAIPTLFELLLEGENSSKLPTLRDGTAVLLFTSGTTGDTKGIVLTHENFISNVEAFFKVFPDGFFQANFLSILPLSHAFELTGGFLTPLYGGGTVTFQHSLKPSEILETMRDTGTEMMLAVPAFLEMIRHAILKKIDEDPKKRKMFKFVFALSRIPNIAFRRFLFREIHASFGGDLRYIVSGGAPLSREIEIFFERLGFGIIQGYGLTEAAPVLTVNPVNKRKVGTVGPAVPGVELRIAGTPEGEILAKGANIMKGYYEDPAATATVLREDFLYTGDIGYLDADGYLTISGRLKNVIVTDTGKKIFPEEIEEKLRRITLIKDVCVIGRKKGQDEEVVAVVIPHENVTSEKIWEEIKRINVALSDFKRVKDVVIWEGEFPKTTTMKVKRRELQSHLENRPKT